MEEAHFVSVLAQGLVFPAASETLQGLLSAAAVETA